MAEGDDELIDWAAFEAARSELGAHFARILRYFEEDGAKSVDAIERAMQERNSVALVVPAHTLKGESLQFGAQPLSELAEKIELAARRFIEIQQSPEELIPDAAKLRPMFKETIGMLEKAINPLVERRSGFGQHAAANQKFGRI